MSRRARHKAETLERILDAAARLFEDRGYAATRTRDIAEVAGIATGTLFNYARTKEEVVLLLWGDRVAALAESGLAAAGAGTEPVAALDALFGPLLAFYDQDRDLGRVFLEQVLRADGADPDISRLNEGFIARIALLLVRWAGAEAMTAAINAFGAYGLVLGMLLAGRFGTVDDARRVLRTLIDAQVRGWPASA